jgi:hypothetical protein
MPSESFRPEFHQIDEFNFDEFVNGALVKESSNDLTATHHPDVLTLHITGSVIARASSVRCHPLPAASALVSC